MFFRIIVLSLTSILCVMTGDSRAGTLFDVIAGQREVVASIPFEKDSSRLSDTAVADLERVLLRIRAEGCNARLIRIEGFSGREGSTEDNFRLALNRAKSVAALLEQKGVPCLAGINGYGDLHAVQGGDDNDLRVEVASYPKMFMFDFSGAPIIEIGEVH